MNEIELFGVSVKVNEDGEPSVKIDFNGEMQEIITAEEIGNLITKEDEEGILKFTMKIVEELQRRMGEE